MDVLPTPPGGLPPESARVSVLVVNWNTKDECLACLDALAEAAGNVAFETIVVDNDSRDGSADALASRDDIDLVINTVNTGFAAAVNQAYRRSHGALVLLLNSDVEFEAGQLGRLVAFLDERPSAAGVSPLYRNPDGTAQPFHFALPTYGAVLGMASAPLRRLPWIARRVRDHALDIGTITNPMPVPQPSASCLLLRRSCLPATEVMDERFPIFFNDVQLARSLAERGHTLWLIPDVIVTHVGHASTRQLGGALRRQYIASLVRMLQATEPRRRVWLYRVVVFTQGVMLYLVRKPGQLSPRQLWYALAGDPGTLPTARQPA